MPLLVTVNKNDYYDISLVKHFDTAVVSVKLHQTDKKTNGHVFLSLRWSLTLTIAATVSATTASN